MITPFNLPSDPQKSIHLREATAGDAIDFCDINENCEEAATSLFLNTVQKKETFYDSKLWTGEDRRFALLWYHLHAEKDNTVLPVTYDCHWCGKEHTCNIDLKEFADEYTEIKGKAERDFVFEGEKVSVRPLNGADLETLEVEQMALNEALSEKGEKSGEYRKQRARIKLKKLIMGVTFSGLADEEKEKKILSFEVNKLKRFLYEVGARLADMRHGLLTEYEDGRIYLITPPQACPEKEEKTRIRVPFRVSEYIPEL